MKRYKQFPLGYNPRIVDGPPDKWYVKAGISWTPKDTEKHRQMETEARIIEVDDDETLSPYHWHEEIP